MRETLRAQLRKRYTTPASTTVALSQEARVLRPPTESAKGHPGRKLPTARWASPVHHRWASGSLPITRVWPLVRFQV